MQKVSQEWKDNQTELLVPESQVEVVLVLTDPDAYADAEAEDNGAIYVSNTEQTVSEVDKDIKPFCTLEQNLWVLDGSREIMPKWNDILPSNAQLTNCTRNGDIFTRKAKVYDSIMSISALKLQPNTSYTIVIDILDDIITPTNYIMLTSDTRFAFQSKYTLLHYGLNFITVVTRENITNDMLGSIWINSPNILPELRFKLSIIQHGEYAESGDCGYIGREMSDANGDFTNAPVVTVNFSEVHYNLISGVTITWSEVFDEYAVDFTVTAYNGDTVVATKDIIGNTDIKTVVKMDIVDYDRITISISKWCLPYRRARIAEILPGVEKTYSKKDLFSFEHSQEVDPISASLPKSEISFSIDNSDNSYNPNNLDSLSKYLIERQEIKSRYGYKVGNKVEWIDCGTFYISEWDAPQSGMTADFKARDLLEFMTGTYYYGAYYPNGISLYDLAVSVLQDADLPLEDDGVVKWVIDESLKQIYTVAPLPLDTHANCLQMIANAGACVIYQDRKGILHIEPFVRKETDYGITRFNSYSKSEISLSKPLKEVDVSCYSYSIAETSSELYKGTMNISGTKELLITYSGAATEVTATVKSGTLNSATYYANACVLNITASGSVTVTVKGKTLEASSVRVITPSGITGETVSVDNALITNQDRATAIGSWVEAYMKNRMVLSSDWRADPRLDALDVVDNENDYNTNKVLITNVTYSYNGSFKGRAEGRVI